MLSHNQLAALSQFTINLFFSGIVAGGRDDLYVSDAFHKAFLEVSQAEISLPPCLALTFGRQKLDCQKLRSQRRKASSLTLSINSI